MITVAFGAVSDTGKLRETNEDSFLVGEHLLAVADGMGGHNAGEVASSMAVQLLRESVGRDIETPELFTRFVSSINDAIYAAALENPEHSGMGTTLTAISISASSSITTDQCVVIVNVGDSRTYIVRNGELRQITVDHSYVQELVSEGVISIADARIHPRRNIVTRALGIDSKIIVDSWILPIVDCDRYVLCSDGLVDEVHNDEILAISMQNADPQRAAECLVAAAIDHGGRDNVTVIVVDLRESQKAIFEIDNTAPMQAPVPLTLDLQNTSTKFKSSHMVRRVLAPLLVLAAILVALLAGAQYTQRGYFVGFIDSTPTSHVAIFKGSPRRFLWYRPTTTITSNISRRLLLAVLVREVDDHPRFGSLENARSYVNALSTTQVDDGG